MNKLIILLNLIGSYKGGAQKRYINLFIELQKTKKDYYLLMNKSLYEACLKDNIITSSKNIIVIPVLFEQFTSNNQNTNVINYNISKKKIIELDFF